jgi:hypothetical protein
MDTTFGNDLRNLPRSEVGAAYKNKTPERGISGVRFWSAAYTALVAFGFAVSNSERSQQDRADKHKGGAESQDIQSQGKVHIGLLRWLD